MLPVPSGDRSAGPLERGCALGGWGAGAAGVSPTDPHYPPPPNLSAAVVMSSPSLSPACHPGIPRPLPSVLLWLWLARCTLPPATPALQEHQDPSRPKARDKSFASIPLCCPAKVWQELMALWFSARSSGAQTASTKLWDGHQPCRHSSPWCIAHHLPVLCPLPAPRGGIILGGPEGPEGDMVSRFHVCCGQGQ